MKTLEKTELNPHETTWYKVLLEGKSCNGGNFHWSLPTLNEDGTYTPGDWHTYEGELVLCESGFHLTTNPLRWTKANCTVFICEVDKNSFGEYDESDNKIVVSKVRLTAVLTGIIDLKENKSHFKDGQLHRDGDLPAVEYANGTNEYANGTKFWYKDGKPHRDNDLPAMECADGTKYWYKDGKPHRDNDLPAIEYADGIKCWYKEGKRHRANDLPAIEWGDVFQEWYKDGEIHRDNDLPAIEYSDGTKQWFKEGKEYTPESK